MDFIAGDDFQEPSPMDTPAFKPNDNIFKFFIAFKAAPIVIYYFGWIILPWTVFQWVATILSAAVDFWFTKNVAGRLILGMRWSSRVNDDGESKWVFEYAKLDMSDQSGQRKTFWLLLYGNVAVWGLFSFFSLIRINFGWVFVCGICLTLAYSNVWGFMKCDKSIKGEVEQSASSFLTQRILPFLAQNAMNARPPL